MRLRGLLVLAALAQGCDDKDSDARARIEKLEAQVATLTAANLDTRVKALEANVGTGSNVQQTLASLQSQITTVSTNVTSVTNYLSTQRSEELYVFDGANHLLGRLVTYDPDSTSVLFVSELSDKLIETALDPVQARKTRGAFVYAAAVGGCTGTPHYTTNQLSDAAAAVDAVPLALDPQYGTVWARTGTAAAYSSGSSFSIGTGGLCNAETLNTPAFAMTQVGTFANFTPGVKIAAQSFALP